jgi:hypothetical protein
MYAKKKIEQQKILKKEEQNNIEKTFNLTIVRVEKTKISKNFVIDDRVNSNNYFNYDVNKQIKTLISKIITHDIYIRQSSDERNYVILMIKTC